MNILQPEDEGLALLALRRSLWQLLVVGVAAAIVLGRGTADVGIPAWWCVLLPLVALAIHLRGELAQRWKAAPVSSGVRPARRRSVRAHAGARRCPIPAAQRRALAPRRRAQA